MRDRFFGDEMYAWTLTPDERQLAIEARDEVMRELGDEGPIIAEDDGPKGPRWWTPTRVYGGSVVHRGVISMLRNPPEPKT